MYVWGIPAYYIEALMWGWATLMQIWSLHVQDLTKIRNVIYMLKVQSMMGPDLKDVLPKTLVPDTTASGQFWPHFLFSQEYMEPLSIYKNNSFTRAFIIKNMFYFNKKVYLKGFITFRQTYPCQSTRYWNPLFRGEESKMHDTVQTGLLSMKRGGGGWSSRGEKAKAVGHLIDAVTTG